MEADNVVSKRIFAAAVYTALRAAGVKWLRFVTCDVSNQIRGKAIRIDTSEVAGNPVKMLRGVGFVACLNGLPGYEDHCVYRSAQGLDYLIGDFGTLHVLPYTPSHAVVYGTLETTPGVPSLLCPRTFLQRQIESAQGASMYFNFGVEMEFVLLDRGKPIDDTNYSVSRAMDIGSEVIDEIVEMLVKQPNTCTEIEVMHGEGAPGQYELVLKYSNDPMKIADTIVTVRETVHAVCRKHKLTATFLPKPFPEPLGNGMHLHMSYSTYKDGPNDFAGDGEYGITEVGGQLLMGVLNNLPALIAITQPTVNSYKRMQPEMLSGSHQCWGFEHKLASIRVCRDQATGDPAHFELKTCDASANPYLAIGSVIACAMSGLQEEAALCEPIGVEVSGDMLPHTLEDVLLELEKNFVLKDALGETLFDCFLAVKRDEAKFHAENDPQLVFTVDPY